MAEDIMMMKGVFLMSWCRPKQSLKRVNIGHRLSSEHKHHSEGMILLLDVSVLLPPGGQNILMQL